MKVLFVYQSKKSICSSDLVQHSHNSHSPILAFVNHMQLKCKPDLQVIIIRLVCEPNQTKPNWFSTIFNVNLINIELFRVKIIQTIFSNIFFCLKTNFDLFLTMFIRQNQIWICHFLNGVGYLLPLTVCSEGECQWSCWSSYWKPLILILPAPSSNLSCNNVYNR